LAKKTTAKGKNGKRKISGSKGKVVAKKQQQTDPRGVIGLIVLCVGILALASQFVSSSGSLLNGCEQLVRGLGGTLCLLLPMVIIGVGAALVFFKENRISMRTIVCVSLIFLFVEAFLQLFEVRSIINTLSADGKAINYGTFLTRSYAFSNYDCTGGGLIGALLAWPLYCALDVWGSAILLLCAVLVTLMFMTGLSFNSLGMTLSEWLDDLRMEIAERREEREAMREMEEEKALEREHERAQQQQKKREEREAKRLREQEEAEAREEAETAAAAQEEPAPQKTRKAKKKTAQAQRNAQEEPAASIGRDGRMSPFDQAGQLYIERDDEFLRDNLEDRPEYRDRIPAAQSFTLEEAQEAFYHGVDAPRRRRGRPETVLTEQPYTPDDASALETAAAAEETPAQDFFETQQETTACQPVDQELFGETDQTDEEFFGDAGEQYSAEPEEAYINDSFDDDAFEQEALQEEEPAAFAPARPSFGGAGAVPSSIPASGIQRAPQERPAAQEDKTIVQLRGTRLDGTPIVMPAKDTHEVPEAAPEYIYPPIDLLERSGKTQDPNQRAKDEAGAAKLLATLENFSVQAKLMGITHGPAITRYELQPGPGVKVSRISNLVDDIALNMAVDGVRIAPIPGKPYVGIEVPNEKIEMVSLRDILESREMTGKTSPTLVALGKGISGAPIAADLAAMPHVLIAGATGSGKSVCINTIINSIIFRASPQEVRLILIDPKVVELSVYNGIPHLLIPVVTDPKKASAALSWAVVEMEHRYKRFESMGVRDIKGYNSAIGPDEEKMSKIIVIIDELADLMMVAPGEVEDSICRLAQLARAAGIHLVIATQRPSVNVITGVIKANIPSRIAFAVSSQIDSRTILDGSGAEKLLGKGDMLYAPQGTGKPTRVQGCFVSDDEVRSIVSYVRGNHEAEYNEDVIEQLNAVTQEEKAAAGEEPSSTEPVDEMLAKAIELAVDAGQVSISMLQRRLRVGYARAGRLVDEMTLRGITGEAEGPTKPRTVLISREEWRRMQENEE